MTFEPGKYYLVLVLPSGVLGVKELPEGTEISLTIRSDDHGNDREAEKRPAEFGLYRSGEPTISGTYGSASPQGRNI